MCNFLLLQINAKRSRTILKRKINESFRRPLSIVFFLSILLFVTVVKERSFGKQQNVELGSYRKY